MKFKTLYGAAALLFLSLITMSNRSGPASNGNGDRSGVSANCGQCHQGTSANASINIQFDAEDGFGVLTPATSYVPGQLYRVRITMTGANVHGFNSRIVGAANTNDVGTMSAANSNEVKITTLGGSVNIAEQQFPQAAGEVFFYRWTAPAAGTGSVRIFAAGVAADDTGFSNNDFHMENMLTITESTGVGVENIATQTLNIFPNPTAGLLNVNSNITEAADYQVDVVDMLGKIVQQQQQNLQVGAQQIQLNVQNLPAGWYQLRISNGKKQITQPFNKF
jgi:hypothetical protein